MDIMETIHYDFFDGKPDSGSISIAKRGPSSFPDDDHDTSAGDQLASPTKIDALCQCSEDTTDIAFTETSVFSGVSRRSKRQRSMDASGGASSSNDDAESSFERLRSAGSMEASWTGPSSAVCPFQSPVYPGTCHVTLPPIGPDGVAVGVPCMPSTSPPPVYGWNSVRAPMSVFAKSSVLAPPAALQDLSTAGAAAILQDVLQGKLRSLPIGLKLDAAAVAEELEKNEITLRIT